MVSERRHEVFRGRDCVWVPPQESTTETEEEYKQRLQDWEINKLHAVEKKVQGNAMTQKYYVEKLLPIYCSTIESLQQIDDTPRLLQEDGDPSHGTSKEGIARAYKNIRGI